MGPARRHVASTVSARQTLPYCRKPERRSSSWVTVVLRVERYGRGRHAERAVLTARATPLSCHLSESDARTDQLRRDDHEVANIADAATCDADCGIRWSGDTEFRTRGWRVLTTAGFGVLFALNTARAITTCIDRGIGNGFDHTIARTTTTTIASASTA
jgi:hypothetical protein